MKKAELFMSYLREEGYVPKLDDDGDIVFKAEGLTLIVFAAEDDQEYFRIVVPNFWSIDNEEERARATHAANRVTAQMKVGKIQLVNDNVWSSVELLIDPIENFDRVFKRSLRILTAAMGEFREAMQVRH